jgi:cell division protein FtsB
MADEPADFGPTWFHTPEFVSNGLTIDGDRLVREAAGRAIGAESKAVELEGELASMRERNARMDQQVEQLRVQLETLAEGGFVSASGEFAPEVPESGAEEQAMFGAHTPVWTEPESTDGPAPEWTETTWSHSEAPQVVELPVEVIRSEPVAEAQPSPEPVDDSADLTASFAGEEIAGVLRAAEDAARRMIERAKATADQQLADVARRRQELEAEAARISDWRRQVGSVVQSMAAEIEEFRAGVEEIPQLLSEAFAPLAQRIPAIQNDIAALAGALGTPITPQSPAEDRQQIAG